jgi:hypothetical protein
VKLQVSSLDLDVALEVGRVTFATFRKVEWVLCLLVSVAFLWRRPTRAEMLQQNGAAQCAAPSPLR